MIEEVNRTDDTPDADGDSAARPAGEPNEADVLAFLDTIAELPASPQPGRAGQTNLIAICQQVQERFGYLPPDGLKEIARRTRMPLSKVHAVVSFYAQLYTSPRGRHTIRCCRGTACHVKGSDRVIDMIRKTLGIDDGETTDDMMFYFETIACLGTCFLAPAMMIDGEYYGKLTPQRVERIIASYRDKAKETTNENAPEHRRPHRGRPRAQATQTRRQGGPRLLDRLSGAGTLLLLPVLHP